MSESEVRVHPLVAFNIADHYVRVRLQGHGPFGEDSADTAMSCTPPDLQERRVLGALFGTEQGLLMEIDHSFELIYEFQTDPKTGLVIPVIDLPNFETNLQLYKDVFEDHDFVGWYSTGSSPFPGDEQVHSTLQKYNESLVYATLDPEKVSGAKDLPLTVYVLQTKANEVSAFQMLTFKLCADEGERVTIDHVAADASLASGDAKVSVVAPHLLATRKAVSALNARLSIVHKFLIDYRDGNLSSEPTRELLMGIQSLCSRLPLMSSQPFKDDFFTEHTDGILLAQLAIATKGVVKLIQVKNQASSAYVGKGTRRPSTSASKIYTGNGTLPLQSFQD